MYFPQYSSILYAGTVSDLRTLCIIVVPFQFESPASFNIPLTTLATYLACRRQFRSVMCQSVDRVELYLYYLHTCSNKV